MGYLSLRPCKWGGVAVHSSQLLHSLLLLIHLCSCESIDMDWWINSGGGYESSGLSLVISIAKLVQIVFYWAALLLHSRKKYASNIYILENTNIEDIVILLKILKD